MKKEVKLVKKMVENEKKKLSKREQKAINDRNWVGKGTMRPGHVMESRRKNTRQRDKVDIRRGIYD